MRSAPLVFVLCTILATVVGSGPSFAQHSRLPSATCGRAATTARSKTDDSRPGFQQYTVPSLYSIEYPEDWFVQDVPGGYVMIWNQRPPEVGGGRFPAGMVKTDVQISPLPFEEAVQAALNAEDDLEMGTITRKGKLTVGGREAYRIWTVEGASNSDSITTLVRYSATETAVVISFFTSGETWAIPTIKDIHWSFRRVLD